MFQANTMNDFLEEFWEFSREAHAFTVGGNEIPGAERSGNGNGDEEVEGGAEVGGSQTYDE